MTRLLTDPLDTSAAMTQFIANTFLMEEIQLLKKQTSAGFVRRKPSPKKDG